MLILYDDVCRLFVVTELFVGSLLAPAMVARRLLTGDFTLFDLAVAEIADVVVTEKVLGGLLLIVLVLT